MPSGPHPYPDLKVHSTSNLTFPWAFYNPNIVGGFDARFGPDGVGIGETMLIFWEDMVDAVRELVGFSWRDTSVLTPDGHNFLRRVLPWQHPYANQLFVKSITSVKGIRLEGTNFSDPEDLFSPGEAGVGTGTHPNTGPWTEYRLAMLTLSFWRPPYYVRSDEDILDGAGNPQEWLRYVDKNWEQDSQMLSREGSCFIWSANGPPPRSISNIFQGSVGQPITKLAVKRRWYEIPEAAIFNTLTDLTPNGLPNNLLYMQTKTTNPITGYVQDAVANPNFYPITFCVNSPKDGGTLLPPASGYPQTGGYIDDTDLTKRFFGCPMGTLLFKGFSLKPRPLQLPPYLMFIPQFGGNEPISQLQYDVEFHFEFFDPPRVAATIFQGHNLMPYSGNGLWYPVMSQNGTVDGSAKASDSNRGTTPFQYADLYDLFKIL